MEGRQLHIPATVPTNMTGTFSLLAMASISSLSLGSQRKASFSWYSAPQSSRTDIVSSPTINLRISISAPTHDQRLPTHTEGVADLLQDVSITTSALIVDGEDGIVLSHLDASTNDTVHLVLHLSITSLDSIKIKIALSSILDTAGSSTTAKTNSVGGTTDLHMTNPKHNVP